MTDANPGRGVRVSSDINFILCEYFNKNGRCIERIFIADGDDDAATNRLRDALRGRKGEHVLEAKKAMAMESCASTSHEDGALALHALIHEVLDERLPLADARKITSLGVNYREAVEIAEVMPALETRFGGHAVNWARFIFSHLKLGPAGMH